MEISEILKLDRKFGYIHIWIIHNNMDLKILGELIISKALLLKVELRLYLG